MDLKPPIASRTTVELLRMASDASTWTPEARALARNELVARGVPTSTITAREEAFAEAECADVALRERNAKERYTAWQLLGLFLFAPLLVLGKLLGAHLFLDIKLGLSELDRHNFKRKYRQRMGALVAGTLFWIALLKSLG
ncbi:MAG: hypothetical protein R2818_00540 [Flavobacteriales bacterium]